jgi:hypothetical protein
VEYTIACLRRHPRQPLGRGSAYDEKALDFMETGQWH